MNRRDLLKLAPGTIIVGAASVEPIQASLVEEACVWQSQFESILYSAARVMNTQPAFTSSPKSRTYRAHAFHSLAHSLRTSHCLLTHLDASSNWRLSYGLHQELATATNVRHSVAMDRMMSHFLSHCKLSSRNSALAKRLACGICNSTNYLPQNAYRNLTSQTMYRHWGWQIYLLHQLHKTEMEDAGIQTVQCSTGAAAAGEAVGKTSLTLGSVMTGASSSLAANYGGTVLGWGLGGIMGAISGYLVGQMVSSNSGCSTPINWSSPYLQSMPPSYMQDLIDYNQLAEPPTGTPITDNYTGGSGFDDAFSGEPHEDISQWDRQLS